MTEQAGGTFQILELPGIAETFLEHFEDNEDDVLFLVVSRGQAWLAQSLKKLVQLVAGGYEESC